MAPVWHHSNLCQLPEKIAHAKHPLGQKLEFQLFHKVLQVRNRPLSCRPMAPSTCQDACLFISFTVVHFEMPFMQALYLLYLGDSEMNDLSQPSWVRSRSAF